MGPQFPSFRQKNEYGFNRSLNIFYIRLTVTIVIAYMILFNPHNLIHKNLAFLFIILLFLTNVVLIRLPARWFYRKEFFFCLAAFDTIMLILGIMLSGNNNTFFFIVFFFIIGIAAMSLELKYLMANTFICILVYGWMLHINGQMVGNLFTVNALKLPFLLTVALLFGYIIQCVMQDINKYLRIGNYALNDSLTGIVLTDLNGETLYVNSSLLNMLGFEDHSELLG